MFFIVLLNWASYWFYKILFPVLTMKYFYVLVGLWLGLAGITNYLFFMIIDRSRVQYMLKDISIALIKSLLLGLFISTMLFALYDMSFVLTASSDAFATQMIAIGSVYQLGWMLFNKVMTILLLVSSALLATHMVSGVAYQLQEERNCRIYSAIMTMVALMCYGLCMMFGYL